MSSTPKAKPFGFTHPEKDCPSFLSRAAQRARNKWNDPAEREKVLKASGSPGFKPTRTQAQQVEMLAAMNLNPHDIGAILGIEKALVEFFFSYELKTASLRTNAAVGKAALEMALDQQHPEMTKFWLQTRAGWVPKSQIDHTGVSKDADDARAAREALLQGDDVQTPSESGEAASGSDSN